MIEISQWNEELLDIESQELSGLKNEVKSNHKFENDEWEKKESPYKEMIENQKNPISRWNREKPEISLTFDDWYWPESIKNILEILRWSWIHATFFILWECIKYTPGLWKQAIEDWHQICCHTYSHAYLSEWPTTDLFRWHWVKPENRPRLIKSWENNVQRLLWNEYYNKIKSENPWAPETVNSKTLLETEILMREEEVKQTLWEEYLNQMKNNYPFFRFPGGCWARRSENIDVLKKHWYLAIWWNGEPKYGIPSKVWNWDIPLFHFDKTNISALKPYITKMKESGKNPKTISEIIVP